MYRPANYYAARTAAIKEALEEYRAQEMVRGSHQYDPMPAPPSAEALRSCGESVQVLLGFPFGDQSGTLVEGTFCYALSKWVFLANFKMDGKQYFVECFYYNKREDKYNYAYSILAVI